jgi:TM2 domain-containing membrane protein YozV
MDQQLLMMLKGLQPDELQVIESVTHEMNDTQQKQFIMFYGAKRKDEQTMLLLTVIGFFAIAGIQRFVIGEIGMGIAYLLTAGFCGIGTIIDLINHKKMTFEYNQKQAYEAAAMVNLMSKNKGM